jgi:dynein light chain 4
MNTNTSSENNSIMKDAPPRPRELTEEQMKEFKKTFTKSIVKHADMSSDLASEASDLIISAIDKQRGNYEGAAKQVKEQMDRKFGPSWHCIIGEGFGFEITYTMEHCMYLFYQGNIAVLLFKC